MCKSSQDFSDYIICFLAVCVLHYVDIVVFPAVNYPSLPAAETWLFDGPLTHTCNRYIVTDGIWIIKTPVDQLFIMGKEQTLN